MNNQKIFEINKKINKAHESYQRGDFEKAEITLSKINDEGFVNDKIFFLQGLIYGAKNQNDKAVKSFEQAIKLNSKESIYYFNLAIALNEMGYVQRAISNYEKTIQLNPNNKEAWLNFGNIFRNLKKYEESLKYYEQALKINQDFVEAQLNMGLSLIDIKEYDNSIGIFSSILKKNKNNINALIGISLALMMKGSYEEALNFSNRCIELDNQNVFAISNRGIILNNLKQYQNAIKDFDHILQKNKEDINALINKGLSLKRLYKYELSKENLLRAIKLDPKNVDALCNIAGVYNDQNQIKLAEDSYLKALKYNQNSPEANYGLAYIYLGNLNFEKGWKFFEWRFLNKKTNIKYFNTSKKEWDGNLNIKKLFVWAEQGIGDQIMFGSILKELENLPLNITVSLNKKIINLFQRSFTKFNFIYDLDQIKITDYDEHISLVSLAKIYRKSINDFNDKSKSYLIHDNKITKKIITKKNIKKITCGISWKSINADIGLDKSIPIQMFEPIFNLKNFEFVNLQYGDISPESSYLKDKFNIDFLKYGNIDLFEDIDSLASLIKSCDLVITSSNSTAHLAGALGINTFLLIPKSRGKLWYWTAIDGKSYWYESIKIFQQIKPDSWKEPIEFIFNKLKKFNSNNYKIY